MQRQSVDSFLEQINQRKSDIQEIAGENSSIEQQQIAELYILSEDLRREAYEEIRAIKEKMIRIWIVIGGILVYIISK